VLRSAAYILPARLLITTSSEHRALNEWYPLADRVANILHAPPALGPAGPTAKGMAAYGGADSINVPLGFEAVAMKGLNHRMIVANLSPAHQSRAKIYNGGFSGHHSDINFTEVYQLVGGFFFGLA